jgi:hypothetical protein
VLRRSATILGRLVGHLNFGSDTSGESAAVDEPKVELSRERFWPCFFLAFGLAKGFMLQQEMRSGPHKKEYPTGTHRFGLTSNILCTIVTEPLSLSSTKVRSSVGCDDQDVADEVDRWRPLKEENGTLVTDDTVRVELTEIADARELPRLVRRAESCICGSSTKSE